MTALLLAVAIIGAEPEAQPVAVFTQELKDISGQLDANATFQERQTVEKNLANAVLVKHSKSVFVVTATVKNAKFSRKDKDSGKDFYEVFVDQPQPWMASAPEGSTDRPLFKLPLTKQQADGLKKGDTISLTGTIAVGRIVDTRKMPGIICIGLGYLALPESQTKSEFMMLLSSIAITR